MFLSQLQTRRLEASKAFVKEKVGALAEMISRETQQLLLRGRETRYSISSSANVLSSSLEASSLRERMFTFLRLADLHVAESIFRHLELFLLDLHVQVCGDGTPSQRSRHANDTSARPSSMRSSRDGVKGRMTRLDTVEGSGSDSCCDYLVPFEVRFQMKENQPPFPVLYALLEDDVDFLQPGDQQFQLHFTLFKTQVLELLHGVIGDYMAAMDETPLIVSGCLSCW